MGFPSSHIRKRIAGSVRALGLTALAVTLALPSNVHAVCSSVTMPAPTNCPTIGDLCDDGSLFAGETDMYVTDANQSTGSNWKNTGGGDDITPDSDTDGQANHTNRSGNLSDFPAFQVCENLSRHGYSDWYLPSKDELNTLRTNRAAIDTNAAENFDNGVYWSSSENGTLAWQQSMFLGTQSSAAKDNARWVRCVRRPGSVTGDPGTFVYNETNDALMYCDDTAWRMAGIGSYNPTAVEFDGTAASLTRGADLTGLADSKRMSGSFWFRLNSLASNQIIYQNQNDRFRIRFLDGTDTIQVLGDNGAGTNILNINTSAIADNNWHHVMFSVDMSDTGKRHLYLDGVSDLTVTTYTDDTLDLAQTDHFVGQNNAGGALWDGDLADVWLDFGTYIDLSIEANRRKFVSSEDMPMYLGKDGSLPTGSAPELFVSGDTATWHTNDGTGGGFTENGALTTAATQPGTCSAEPGTLALIDSDDPGLSGDAIDVWGDTHYIYMAHGSGGIAAYSFDGTTLTFLASFNTPVSANDVWGDGTYIYVADDDSLRAYTFDGHSFTEVGSTASPPTKATGVWGDGTYIYVTDGFTDGLLAYTFDGSTFTAAGSPHDPTGETTMVWGDGTYIYTSGWANAIQVHTFNGTAFNELAEDNPSGGSAFGVWGDGTYIYNADGGNGLHAYSFDGVNTLTLLDTYDTPLDADDVYGDGRYIYVADDTDLVVLSFDGTSFSLEGSIATAGDANGVWSDGTYVYVADGTGDSLNVYSGFKTCSCGVNSKGEIQDQGVVQYNADFSVMEYCNGVEWVPMGPNCPGAGTWTARSASEANQWNSVTYGNGQFVAVSTTGTNRVMTSPDGITWTARSASEANQWRSVAYAEGLFVAVASDGTNRVMTSPDGITWTARSASEANQWNSVTYGDGLFVAVSTDGTNRVMTSPDGITWTARSAAEANNWLTVTYGDGQFVAVSSNGTNRVMTSPDGITWTARSAAEANGWASVSYGNDLFVATSWNGTNQVMTSPDGITWTARSAAEANQWWNVTYGNGLFVAVSDNGTNQVMTSRDGITWTAEAAPEANFWSSVTYGGDQFVAVSTSGTNRVMTGGCKSSGGNCTSPARTEGAMIYNTDNDFLQYCNGEDWIGIGK